MSDGAARTIAVIGVGLMGGSLGLAARERAGVAEVRGFSQTRATLDLALERGAITVACDSLEEAAAGADLVFVCTPVRLVVKHVKAALAAAPPHAVISDVGSTKGPLMRALIAAGAGALRGRAPAVRLGDGRRRQRPRLAVRRRHLLRDARRPRLQRGVPAPVRLSRRHRRAAGGRRPRGARPPHGRGQPPAARAGQRAHDAGRPAPGLARRPHLGRPQLPRPHARRRQQPARVDRHLPREPRGPAGGAGDLPAGPAGGARGARRQRRRAPRPDHRQGPRPAPAHARRRQPRGAASCAASSCTCPTVPACSARSWSPWATPASTSRTSPCTT